MTIRPDWKILWIYTKKNKLAITYEICQWQWKRKSVKLILSTSCRHLSRIVQLDLCVCHKFLECVVLGKQLPL